VLLQQRLAFAAAAAFELCWCKPCGKQQHYRNSISINSLALLSSALRHDMPAFCLDIIIILVQLIARHDMTLCHPCFNNL
jgi:hypothetical protein